MSFMSVRFLISFLLHGVLSGSTGQNIIDLTFTAVNNGEYVKLDSIMVMNRSQGNSTMMYWPDTIRSIEINQGDLLLCVGYASLSPVGVSEEHDEKISFEVHQNYPNPMGDQSNISIYIPQNGLVHLTLSDLTGKVVLRSDRQLDQGYHSFRYYPGDGNLHLLTVNWHGINRSIKMISKGHQDGKSCRLDYIGGNTSRVVLKATSKLNDFVFHESGILDSPLGNTTYTFQFATNIPCPGTPTVDYEGQLYNTIQILSQCWLKENLNVGTMINSSQYQTNNSIMEKYCYNNSPDSCTKYGGLYQWDEMMQYTNQEGVQGICPSGWHLPTDDEWKVLEGAADSHYLIGDAVWYNFGFRGSDVGANLKTSSGWYENGNGTDQFGFSGLPGGIINSNSYFNGAGNMGYWWTSTITVSYHAWMRYLHYISPCSGSYLWADENGFSVRCIKDY